MPNLPLLLEQDIDLGFARPDDIISILDLRDKQHRHEKKLDPTFVYEPMDTREDYIEAYHMLQKELFIGYPFNWVYYDSKGRVELHTRAYVWDDYIWLTHMVSTRPILLYKASIDLLKFSKQESFAGCRAAIHKVNPFLKVPRRIAEKCQLEEIYSLRQSEQPDYYYAEFSWEKLKTPAMPN
jgi:hypothetical protein